MRLHRPPWGLSDQEASFEWRLHHFWKCPVAAAIVGAIRGQIPGGGAISCADIWLLRPPPGVTHSGVWGMVAAAAIAAMHYGGKNLILHLGREELGGGTNPHHFLFPSCFRPLAANGVAMR